MKNKSTIQFDFVSDGLYDLEEVSDTIANAVDEVIEDGQVLEVNFEELDYEKYPGYEDQELTQGTTEFEWDNEYSKTDVEDAIRDALSSFSYEVLNVEFTTDD